MNPAWEGIAADVLSSTGCDEAPVSALELAEQCGLGVVRTPQVRRGNLVLEESRIEINPRLEGPRLHGTVAHEVGHWALDRARVPNEEDGARYLAGAFLLPRAIFLRDLQRTEWSLVRLRELHPNASAEMIARRLVQLRDAVASIWDHGKCTARVASPWLTVERVGRRTSALERALADRALETGEVQRPADLVWAVPVFAGGHRRVIVIAEAEQLALRWPGL